MPNVELFVRTMKPGGVFVDQSRIGAALGLGVASRVNLEAGYLRQGFVYRDSRTEVHHVVQVTARVLPSPRPDR